MSPFIKTIRRGLNRAFAPKNLLTTARKIANTVRDIALPVSTAVGMPMLGAEVALASGAAGKVLSKVKNTIEKPMPKIKPSDVTYSQ